jgi:flavin reductase (DIM6/NTAB) family NADH-FMN oxidoreductase RutF
MPKIKFGMKNCLYPNPMILVGVNYNGKPTYTTVSYCAIANRVPAMMMISLNKSHYISAGIKESDSFSINIPSADMIEKTDYCGLVSGKAVDKSELFNTFYGVLEDVPMIKECPINMELKIIHSLELEGTNQLIIGQVIESYSEEKYLTNDLPDLKKINPILLSMDESNYYNVGEVIGKAWSVGKSFFESNY